MQASGDSPIADSVASVVDTVAAVAAPDSSLISDSSGVGQFGREVGEAGSLLAQGKLVDAFETLVEALVQFSFEHVIPAFLVGLAFWIGFRLVRGVVEKGFNRSKHIDTGVQQLLLRVLRIVVFAFATVTVLSQLGIQVAPLIAGLGIAGLAIGFASQDTVRNLIAGVTILIDRPFRVGDNIELQDTFGTVQEITLRSTRVRTMNNEIAILPNAKVIEEKIVNHSMHRALRVCIPFGIAYKESPEQARQVVLSLTEEDGRLHPDYEPRVVVTELGESSVDMELRLFLKDSKLEIPVGFEYRERVFEALKAADIEIPFPHLQLFIDEAKAFENGNLPVPPSGQA